MKGFTILELVISMAIMSVIVLALITVFDVGHESYFSSVKVMDVMRVFRGPMDAIAKEVRQSKASDMTITNGGSQIQFIVLLDIDPVTYSSPITYSLSNNQLIREHPPGVTTVIATNVDSINFSLAANRLDIDLQARATLKKQDLVYPLNETITLRN